MITVVSCVLLATTAVLVSAQGSYGCSGNGMDDGMRDTFLKTHNDHRRSMAQGKEKGLSGGKNVYQMKWSCDYESQAASYISSCPGDLPSTPGMGVNLQLKYGSYAASPTSDVTTILQGWWDQSKAAPLPTGNTYPGGPYYQFANMANGTSTEIGCAYKVCPVPSASYSKLVVACYYSSVGFHKNGVIYEPGMACSADRECTTYAGSTCSTGLCVKGSAPPPRPQPLPVVPPPRPVVPAPQPQPLPVVVNPLPQPVPVLPTPRPAPVVVAPLPQPVPVPPPRPQPVPVAPAPVQPAPVAPAPGGSINCPSNILTPAVRNTFLTAHNNYRSTAVLGNQKDALGGNTPRGSKMARLTWDCALEASAQSWASGCLYAHSQNDIRPGSGENIWMTTDPNFDYVASASQASMLWWTEIAQYGVGPSNILTPALWSRPKPSQIGHYTQMAWADTTKIGCGIAHCQGMTFGVCHYNPSGNFMNQLIYPLGAPCSACGAGSTCDPSVGLC